MKKSTSHQQCPICGKNNNCKFNIDNKSTQLSCWCQTAELCFPVNLLAQLPSNLKDKSCICQECAIAYQTGDKKSIH